ncbi:ABC transporter substrate-binding protein [Nakamurella deserti]|uniref:ABC transporter substrate-binding protein n=1 Tax=Nakamurella deserti TaxID=2164074 RepID=UPI000DBE2C18
MPVKRPHRTRRVFAAATAAALAVTLASCASSSRDTESIASQNNSGAEGTLPVGESSGGATGEPASTDGTIIFGAEGAPSMFDPLYATDGATFKVTRQMTEGLVAYTPGTADIEPSLAESWEPSEDGLTWTFKIRQGVKFHDGTDLDAAAVCFNFDRMYSQSGAGATQAQYWSDTMGGFKDQVDDAGAAVPSIYSKCTASDAGTAVIELTRVTSKFPNILGLPSFSIQSPAALEQYDANNVVAEGDSFKYPAYALEHPTGTGPFTFSKYDTANGTVELTRNEDYWGDKAKSKTLIFKIIPDESARKQELQAGTIDGYDLPSPGDWEALTAEGNQVLVRPAFNVLYLGLNPKNNPALLDLKVRQAIAYALNRSEFVTSQLPEGAEVALEFYPKTVDGWTDTVTKYDYDQEKAKSLLAEAGQSNLTLNFWWPTEVSRPYMPNPSAIFQAFKADLEAVGITVNETSKPWNGGYLDGVDAQQADAFLLGWTGDYNSPDNFIGTFFSDPTSRFDTADYPWGAQLSEELATADSEPDADKRAELYVTLNEKLMGEYLPAVPISHSPPALVVSAAVQGLVPSPLTDERFVGAYKTN